MNNTRFFTPVGLLSLAAVVILVLAIGFVAWLNIPDVSFSLGGLALRDSSPPEPVVMQFSRVNAEGLAIYHQSERGLTLPRANAEGLAIYHRSERGLSAFAPSNDAGLEIYWQSERGSAVQDFHDVGMSIYLQSERNIPLAESGPTDEGMAIYYASERGR